MLILQGKRRNNEGEQGGNMYDNEGIVLCKRYENGNFIRKRTNKKFREVQRRRGRMLNTEMTNLATL